MHESRTFSIPVLLAEDNPLNQELVCEFLADTPFAITIAENGQRAVDVFTQQHFELVLMDCQMPIMDGLEATRVIRRIEAEKALQRTPIIAVTANAIRGDRDTCLAAGMDDYLSKPFSPEVLIELLVKWAASPQAS
ncbi:response regulator [Uliginosibacterium sp. H1]|uniref:response regulator n=1 Tax=Uliginosibacterium sp. H1 TaxID=3114757 RepID=UPI002E18F9D2|nr:response regulator [Uliginosibacterium sp. H1]